jgi:hypothetical protein
VRDQLQNSVKRIHRATGGAGKVHDQHPAPGSGERAGEWGEAAGSQSAGTHEFAEPGYFTFDYIAGRFRCYVAGGNAGSACGEDNVGFEDTQTLRDLALFIGHYLLLDYMKTGGFEAFRYGWSGGVSPGSAVGAIADGEHRGRSGRLPTG